MFERLLRSFPDRMKDKVLFLLLVFLVAGLVVVVVVLLLLQFKAI